MADTESFLFRAAVRVNVANHLGTLLTRATPRAGWKIEDHRLLIAPIQQWSNALHSRALAPTLQARMRPHALSEFQDGYYRATRLLRRAGIPAEHP